MAFPPFRGKNHTLNTQKKPDAIFKVLAEEHLKFPMKQKNRQKKSYSINKYKTAIYQHLPNLL
jgi:hypothetical protein